MPRTFAGRRERRIRGNWPEDVRSLPHEVRRHGTACRCAIPRYRRVADDAVGDHELFGWYPVHIAFADYQAVSEKLAGTIFEVEQSLEPEPFGERVASNTVIGTEGGHDIFVVLVYAGGGISRPYIRSVPASFDVLFEVVDR